MQVKCTPEEEVRQHLIYVMLKRLGYPEALLCVETHLKDVSLPHFSSFQIPNRRIDLLCFQKKMLHPLLMVECKANQVNEKTIAQVIGYNEYVGASFIALATKDKILTGYYEEEKKGYTFIDDLPSYESLLRAIHG